METTGLIKALRERKDNLDRTIEDITSQERDLWVRRSRIEGQLYEIEFALENLEVEDEVR